ncbi:MAG TPA: thioredoxin-like domain-containing protein [Pyrinomonadaceae bacterium]|jgi:DNA-binding beta-propeller fold protein YncE
MDRINSVNIKLFSSNQTRFLLKINILFILSILFLSTFGLKTTLAQTKIRAAELAGGKGWLNTEKPLSLAALKGKVVLLDFWTYGCINCIHIIPDLKKLEEKYPNQLVIIGVHSAKFDNESETENIRKIILRYGIEHPVVNDADFKIWNAYGIIAYPGLVLIDPEGYIVQRWFGEGQAAEIEAQIAQTVEDFRRKGVLREQPLKFTLEKAKVGDLPLAFPGKVLADAKSNRLFISDSNHNRIVVTDLNGKLLDTIGSGKTALADGGYADASFYHPQGLALDGEMLYVADTENHAIRRVDLQKKTVETIAGNGKQAEWRATGGSLKTAELNSPWDLVKTGNSLYIAMAGTHQIWELDFEKQTVQPFAGTGAEARLDGGLSASSFAQPSGIAFDGKNLFVADAESNIIREIDLRKQSVETLVGGDLFIFGDEDGEGTEARLQHPLGVAFYNGSVFVADTYNHKIKILDPSKQTVKTFLGSGKSGQTDGKTPTFYEPAGLSVAGGKLYVADTNNHAIRVVDLKTKTVSTLKIEGLTPPAKVETETFSPNLSVIKFPAQEVNAQAASSLVFDLKFPEGYHLNQNAPNRYEITVGKASKIEIASAAGKYKSVPLTIPFRAAKKGASVMKAKLTVYYCREDNTGVCLIKTLEWEIPLKIVAAKNASGRIELKETLKAD